MTFPVGSTLSTPNLSSNTGNPASSRSELYAMAVLLNQIIASVDLAGGVPILDGAGYLKSTQMPTTLAPTATLSLSPSTGFVKINNILRLQIMPRATLLATADVVTGDIALYADDLTGANAGIAVFDGTDWRILAALANLTVLS